MVLAEFKSHPRRSGQPWAFAVKKKYNRLQGSLCILERNKYIQLFSLCVYTFEQQNN